MFLEKSLFSSPIIFKHLSKDNIVFFIIVVSVFVFSLWKKGSPNLHFSSVILNYLVKDSFSSFSLQHLPCSKTFSKNVRADLLPFRLKSFYIFHVLWHTGQDKQKGQSPTVASDVLIQALLHFCKQNSMILCDAQFVFFEQSQKGQRWGPQIEQCQLRTFSFQSNRMQNILFCFVQNKQLHTLMLQ